MLGCDGRQHHTRSGTGKSGRGIEEVKEGVRLVCDVDARHGVLRL
jgi:hypothetical protein